MEGSTHLEHPSTDQDDGQPNLRDLSRQIRELEERVQMLTVSVQFQPDQAWLQEHVLLHITGQRRTCLQFLLYAIMARVDGVDPGGIPAALAESLGNVPSSLSSAFVHEPIDWNGAVSLVANLLGSSEEVAVRLINAHEQAGFSPSSHARLKGTMA